MNKILLIILISINVFALDLSISSGNDQNHKEDTQLGYSKNMSMSTDTDKTKTNSKTKETSISTNKNVSKIEQVTSFVALQALEKAGIKPFSNCNILTKPRLLKDFDLNCDNNGYTNGGRCTFLENAAKSNMSISEATYQEDEIKSYTACVALYGALIAQDMKYDKFSPNLYDSKLKEIYEEFSESLEDTECRFNNSVNTIVCGSARLTIDFEPSVTFSGISLYSDKTYFGYSSSESKDKSKRLSKAFTMSKSKRKSKANNIAKSLTINNSESVSIQKASNSNLSLSKFLPAE